MRTLRLDRGPRSPESVSLSQHWPWVGLTHLSTQGLHPLSDRKIEKSVGPEAVNQRT